MNIQICIIYIAHDFDVLGVVWNIQIIDSLQVDE